MNSNKSKLKLISKSNFNEIDDINDEQLKKRIDCISEIAAMQTAIEIHNEFRNTDTFRCHTPPYYIKDIRHLLSFDITIFSKKIMGFLSESGVEDLILKSDERRKFWQWVFYSYQDKDKKNYIFTKIYLLIEELHNDTLH
mgnify:FL=1|tara:strand:- start:89 stop:508 length:420 start_codon:yes stop_codon:yes gene_type:complete